MTVRILIAAGLGALVGLERELSEQPAGFRTNILVAVGAALFSIVGAELGTDPTRVAAQVVTGIGFLGAGAILRQGLDVRGLTTAAALWVTASVGTAAGMGLWEPAVVATIVTVVSLFVLKRVGGMFFRNRTKEDRPS